MLVLFETPGGYAIFKVLNEKKLKEPDNIWKEFETPEKANEIVKLVSFKRFQDTTDALQATASMLEAKVGKGLKKLLKKCVVPEVNEQLAVADAKLGAAIKDKMNINCVANSAVAELMRGIRAQMDTLVSEMPKKDMSAMALGLAHSLGRYKLKFSSEKVDTMIIQAVSLLDDLDKELNNYVMRCREWYGWHFPEMVKLLQTDHIAFAKAVQKMGVRQNASSVDLTDILPEDVAKQVQEAAEISMGTEISETDILNISHLCEQIIEISSYRTQLYEYLKNRMMALAPNLTILLGELVGARLISHAGSLMNLAKYPASTIQILGAEKALFRALKTKRDTPKYGLIYHAQLIGHAPGQLKGKMSRMLAAKAAIACRVDALGEDVTSELGTEHRAKLETRIKQLQDQGTRRISGTGREQAKFGKFKVRTEGTPYDAGADSTIPKKRKFEEVETPVKKEAGSKKAKEEKRRSKAADEEEEEEDEAGDADVSNGVKNEPQEEEEEQEEAEEEPTPKKKKKSKKHAKE